MPNSTQGYGFTISGGSLNVDLIDAKVPDVEVTMRESSTLSNEAWATKMANKLKEAGSVDLIVDISDSSTVYAAVGTNVQYTLAISGVFSFVGWGIITGIKPDSVSARTHDHDMKVTFTLEWTNQNDSHVEVAPTWDIT